MTRSVSARPHLWLAGLGYLAFVVYGSLVPLDFRALPMDEALARFRQIPWLDLGIASRADWMANLLLFIPLAFLFTGALAQGRGPAVRVAGSLLVLAAGVGLSFAIEFTQLFFPQRTVSQNDLAAESLGALLGILAWWGFGERLVAASAAWLRLREPAALSERLAWMYLAFLFAYNLLPLDLTISFVEIFHKWREGKLVLLPFSALPADPAQAFYEVVTDALIWLPPAFLLRQAGNRGTARAGWLVFAAALLLEGLQLFVYSRVSDVTDLFTAALGARLARRGIAPGTAHAGAFRRILPLLLALGWLGVLLLVFWYPFDFRIERAFVEERLAFIERVPFEIYYYGTEFRAVTSVFQKILFFAPLGALLAWFVAGLPWLWRGWAAAASILCILLAALGVELGQVLLPDKHPDTTDWVLESLGGILGYALVRAYRARTGRVTVKPPGSQPSLHSRADHGRPRRDEVPGAKPD